MKLSEFRRALQEDPLNTGGRLVLTSCLILKGDLDEAVAEARQSLEINPGFAPAWSQLSLIHYLRGKSDEAYECAEKAYSLSPWVPMATGALAGQLLRRGDKNRSDELLRQLGDGQAYGAAYGLAIHDMFSGATDRLPERLERLIEQRYPMVPGLLRGPIGKSLRSHPRWPAIVEMVRLPNL
jgi:tetratricopeptide (TPR) repeat protein